jgi:transcriptional regulator with XRE-family HTH domain
MAYGIEPDPRDGVPKAVKKAEGEALHRLWKRLKKRTQAEFMASLGKSPGYFPQFFSGQRPITMELALAIAHELDVDIVEFSPRLAKESEKALEASEWPFKRFSRTEYHSLTKAQKEAVEAFVVAFLPENKPAVPRKFPRLV